MQINRNDLQHLTSVQHQGFVFLFGIDSNRDLYYAVRRTPTPPTQQTDPEADTEADPEADTAENESDPVAAPTAQWGEWVQLPLPADQPDLSVSQREREAGTEAWVRSQYNTARRTALAPLQVLSDGEHLFVFRQSLENTLFVDRFLLDGGTERLVRKLEVRFKRSRQRFTPAQPQGLGGNQSFDTTDFRDFAGNFFFEPTQELRLSQHVTQGWFSVVLTNTSEHEVSRWHIFAHNAETGRLDLFSIRRSGDRLFDLADYTVEEGTLNDPQPRPIPGLIKRTLILRDAAGEELAAAEAPTATRFCLQTEMTTQDGDTSFIKGGVRVMLAVPVRRLGAADAPSTLASLVFGVRTDGTLAQIDDLPQETLLLENSRDVLLPADVLQQVRGISGNQASDPDTSRPSFTFDGVDDYIDVGSDRSLDFTRNFSIEAWVWPAVEKEQWIFAKQDSYGLGLVNGNPVFATYNGARYVMENVSVPLNTWTHLAVVLDRRNTLSFYINGELADSYEGATPARPSSFSAKIGVQDPEAERGFWQGWLADVRVWNEALGETEIQQRMADRLLGRELGLTGYWPLTALANGETADFSPESNTGRVLGALLTGRRIERQVGGNNAEAYRYGEVFGVVQGATYLETFEYRTDIPNLPFDEAAEAFEFVFEGLTGGRNGEPTDPVRVQAQIRPLEAANDDGWRVAQARFTVPEGMTHLRLFHITAPGGEWNTLEIRRHRIAQLADTITQAEFVDEVRLPALADDFAEVEADLDRLPPLEQEEARLVIRLRELDAQLASANPEQTLRDAVNRQQALVNQRTTLLRQAEGRLNRERENPFNRYAYLVPRSRGAGDFPGRLQFLGNLPFLSGPTITNASVQWALVVTDSSSANPRVQIHHRSSENLRLSGGLTRDRTDYDRLLVLNANNSPEFEQTWEVEFLSTGAQARVRLRLRTPGRDIFNHLLTRRPDGSIGIDPAATVARGRADAEWILIDFDRRPGQNLHPAGARLIAELTTAVANRTRDLETAQARLAELQADLANVSNLSAIRDQVRADLLAVQAQIREIRARYLAAIATLTNRPQTLPLLPTTDGGTVQGALLGFASPAAAITAYESVVGAVHLNFFDSRGRLRTLPYDAVSEVWQPSLPGTCLDLQADANPAYVTVPGLGGAPDLGQGLNAFTWEGWLRSTEPNTDAVIAAYTTGDRGWQVSNLSDLRVTLNDATSPAQGIHLADGQWHHLAITWQSLTGQLTLYVDGLVRYSGELARGAFIPVGGTLSWGATATGSNPYIGFLDAVRLWSDDLSASEVEAYQHLPSTGNEPGLLGDWPLEDLGRTEVRDRSPNGYHGTLVGPAQLAPSTVPLGRIEAERTLVVANEYPTQEVNTVGQAEGLMRRFYAFFQTDAITLLQDQRIEGLEVRWVGNAQFDPTLLGYIEGAPPVPSENFTEADSYDGTATVQLTATENVTLSWTRAQEAGLGIEVDAILGSAAEVSAGLLVMTSVEAGFGFTGNLSSSYSLLDEGTITLDITNAFQDRLSLRGSQEPIARFPHLGKRYLPKNVGYALVVSSLADVFVLRLRRSRRMVSYQVAPVPDLPPQVNTITFLINPAYQQNGTLDGQVGTAAADDRFYAQVPNLRAQYGSRFPASYFRLQEAAELEAQIRRQDREREALFVNYNSRAIEVGAANRSTDNANEDNIEQVAETAGSDISTTVEMAENSSSPGWQRRLEQLLVEARKRNIVNTYVWDGDGGLRSETQEFADTIEQTIGGSFSLAGGLGVTGFVQGGGVWVELTALATAHITQVSTKTESRSRGFSLNVELEGESRGITRLDDTAVIPGEKVDRYRFSSFYLEPSTRHFNDFFHQVVDPEWLMSNDEEARALRQISMVRPNPVWRVRHLVTFVERPVLQGFGTEPQAATLEAIAASPATNGNGSSRRAMTASAER